MDRFCLIDGARKARVHKVKDDAHPLTRCGRWASMYDRYSRRNVTALKNKPDCGNCSRTKES